MANNARFFTEEYQRIVNEDIYNEIAEYKEDIRQQEIQKELTKWLNSSNTPPTEEEQCRKCEELKENMRIEWDWKKIAEALRFKINAFHCVTFKEINTETNKVLYWYDWDKGIYTRDIGLLNKIINAFNVSLPSKKREELKLQLTYTAEEKELDNTGRYIVFNNGTYDSLEHELVPRHFHTVYTLRACEYDYIEHKEEPSYTVKNVNGDAINWQPRSVVEAFKNGDDNREALFWQLLRAILSPCSYNHVFLYAYNERGNGAKSTIGELLKALAGSYKNMNLSAIGQRFALVGIERAPLIYGDDNDTKSTLKGAGMELFKSITQGIAVPIEEKGSPIYEGTFCGVWWQCSNAPMQFDDFNGSLDRRIILLPFKEIPKEQRSADVLSDLIKRKEVIEWFISETIKREPEAIQAFTKPKDNARQLEQLKEDNDPYSAFFSECIEPLISVMSTFPTRFIARLATVYGENVDSYFLHVSRRALKLGITRHMERAGYSFVNASKLNKEERIFLLSFEKETTASEKSDVGRLVGAIRCEVGDLSTNYGGAFKKGKG